MAGIDLRAAASRLVVACGRAIMVVVLIALHNKSIASQNSQGAHQEYSRHELQSKLPVESLQAIKDRFALIAVEKQLMLSEIAEPRAFRLSLERGTVSSKRFGVWRVQVVGQVDASGKHWTWGWSNKVSIPDELRRAALDLKQFGLQHQLPEFTAESFARQEPVNDDLELLVSGLCMATCYLSLPVDDGRMVVLVFDDTLAAELEPVSRVAALSAMTQELRRLGVSDHRASIRSYCQHHELDVDDSDIGFRVSDRIGSITLEFDGKHQVDRFPEFVVSPDALRYRSHELRPNVTCMSLDELFDECVLVALESQVDLDKVLKLKPRVLDLEQGTFVVNGEIVRHVQVLLFRPSHSKQWIWAWSPNCELSDSLCAASLDLKRFGERCKVNEFITEKIDIDDSTKDPSESLLAKVAMTASWLCKTEGYARLPIEDGEVVVLLTGGSVSPPTPIYFLNLYGMLKPLRGLPVSSHSAAILHYCRHRGLDVVEKEGRLEITDRYGRVTCEFDSNGQLIGSPEGAMFREDGTEIELLP